MTRRSFLRSALAGAAGAAAGLGLGFGTANWLGLTGGPKKDIPAHVAKAEPGEVETPESPKPEPEVVNPAQRGFDYDGFRQRLAGFEGYRNRAYNDGRGVRTIGVGHAMGRNQNDQLARQSRERFRQVFGDTVSWNMVWGGAALTNDQVDDLADEDIDVHLRRARNVFPDLNTYPDYVQFALVDAIYRGDMGPRTAALIRNGDWRAAANEYIDRSDYRNARRLGVPGIRGRMDQNRAAMIRYSEDL